MERPLRTALTMLGIIIGVAAVYAMLSIGEGTRQKILDDIDSVQGRTISIYPNWNSGRASQRRPWRPFTESDVLDMQSIRGAYAATGESARDYSIVSETSDWQASVVGIDPEYMAVKDLTMARGRAISQADLDRRDTVAVIGPSVLRSLFRGQNPIGQRIKIQNIPFEVVGITTETEARSWNGQDANNFVFIPRPTARARLFGDNYLVRNSVNNLIIVGKTQDGLANIESEVDYLLRRSRNLAADEAPDFRIFNFSANRQAYAKSQRTFSLLLATMGAVSLIVGGVGVMNIMLVSVTERTREIGLRMAIGARDSDILAQFLTEAILLSVLSGLLGLALGYGVSQLSLGLEDIEMVFSPRIAVLSFGSAVLIGVVFGFLPARRASRLNPIEALRHE
ncbi:MAG: ABC transporter permease [Henriciella sp.]|nr:ABC transporter permease [Henriciella sp.]